MALILTDYLSWPYLYTQELSTDNLIRIGATSIYLTIC
jgi:hypothetical protein